MVREKHRYKHPYPWCNHSRKGHYSSHRDQKYLVRSIVTNMHMHVVTTHETKEIFLIRRHLIQIITSFMVLVVVLRSMGTFV
jgi:hypothetical protein